MENEKTIAVLNSHKVHWERLLRENICDKTEGEEFIEALDKAVKALDERPITCNECNHQKSAFHKDKRMKKGGYTYYWCELNGDPFVAHVVDGQPWQYCSEVEMKDEESEEEE